MEAKDIITATVASLALIISCIGLWRSIRADRRSTTVEFEQKKQEALSLYLENQLSQESRLRKLIKLRAQIRAQIRTQTPVISHVNDFLDHFIGTFEDTISTQEFIQERLREIPSSKPDNEASVGIERILGQGRQQKTYATTWDRNIDEFIEQAQKITALQVALEEINMDLEGAEEERQRKKEELGRLDKKLAEVAQSAIETEEEVTGDEEVEGDKPEKP